MEKVVWKTGVEEENEKNKNGEWENKRSVVGLGKTKYVGKIVTDVLGNSYTVDKEKFSFIIEK